MSRWLARALWEISDHAELEETSASFAQEIRDDNIDSAQTPNEAHWGTVPKWSKSERERNFGHFEHFGTASEIEIEERVAMALEGGVPALYAPAFATMQIMPPADRVVGSWQQAVDDAGHFLDAWGDKAASLGWTAEELFGPGGLVWLLKGATVSGLTPATAGLSDSRTHRTVRSISKPLEQGFGGNLDRDARTGTRIENGEDYG